MVKPKCAKKTQQSAENTSEEEDPTSSTQLTATDTENHQFFYPNASTQPEEKTPEEYIDPATVTATKAIDVATITE